MKKIKSTIRNLTILAFALCGISFVASPPPAKAAGYTQVQGLYIDGSTNTIAVGGSNVCVSVVQATATNIFNLPGAANNTNYWPALAVPNSGNINPVQLLCMQHQISCVASNGGTFTLRWAASSDYSHWTSNALVQTWTLTGTTPVANTISNVNMAGTPFYALQVVEHPGGSPVTNWWFNVVGKPGL